jgi:NADP-dependent 3-hydroxy acid dehydrogenase YdfG
VVTKANAGIGQAIATALGGAGAHVICAGRSAVDETIARIKAAGGAASDLDVRIPTKPATHSDNCVGRGPDAPLEGQHRGDVDDPAAPAA